MTGGRVVIMDACLLINLLLADSTDLLADLSRYDFGVTEMVRDEIRDEAQAAALTRLISDGAVRLFRIDDPETIRDIEMLCEILGRGEASSIALACRDECVVGTDDGKAASLIEDRLGPGHVLSTPGLLVEAIRSDLMTVAEADGIKSRLEEMRFRMAFDSFSGLV